MGANPKAGPSLYPKQISFAPISSGEVSYMDGIAFAQAAEEEERKGDYEKALALYIQATECLFAADPG